MDEKEYRYKLDKIEHECTIKKTALYREHALSNNTIKVEDIIQDHLGFIKVGKIGFYLSSQQIPMCRYIGVKYTKQKKPFKSGESRAVYQENILKR